MQRAQELCPEICSQHINRQYWHILPSTIVAIGCTWFYLSLAYIRPPPCSGCKRCKHHHSRDCGISTRVCAWRASLCLSLAVNDLNIMGSMKTRQSSNIKLQHSFFVRSVFAQNGKLWQYGFWRGFLQ